jgi:predicted nucleic acid-binding Zn ribbon protein
MSKYQKYKQDDDYIYPHKHCRCGHMMGEDQEYCSEECRTKFTQKSKKSKKSTIGIVLIWVAVIVVFILLLVFLRPA